jgi:hypothetical protein
MSFQRPGSRSKSAFGVSFTPSSGAAPGGGGGGGGGRGADGPPSTSGRGGAGGGHPHAPHHHQQQHHRQPPPHQQQQRQRPGSDLPIARCRRQILYLIESHATVVIVGETGSGKTTQLPQILLDAGWADGGAQVRAGQHS